MSILVIAVNPTGTAEAQQKIAGRLRAGQTPPAGLIFQVASPADPGYQVISVWDSLESFTRFRDERLNPALEAEGVSPGHLTIKTFPGANYRAFEHADA